MKTKIALGIFALAGLSLASCDDFLDNNRYPLTSEVSNPEFWSNESLVEQECNDMYNFFSGYGRGNSLGEFYFSTLSDDQAGNSFTEWNNKTVRVHLACIQARREHPSLHVDHRRRTQLKT